MGGRGVEQARHKRFRKVTTIKGGDQVEAAGGRGGIKRSMHAERGGAKRPRCFFLIPD